LTDFDDVPEDQLNRLKAESALISLSLSDSAADARAVHDRITTVPESLLAVPH
jgi:hypothetical protein